MGTAPAAVGMHLKQSFRRLRALARRRAGISRRYSRGSILLEHFAALRQRGLELQRKSPGAAAAIDLDVRAFATLLAGTDGGPSRGEAHAFLAELFLGEERIARTAPRSDVRSLLGAEFDPSSDQVARGLRHLKAAQDLAVDSRFIWLARIHATYLLESDPARIDWQRLVGLYEQLLRITARDPAVS
jgi:predicted RNA polymerase sigma factor